MKNNKLWIIVIILFIAIIGLVIFAAFNPNKPTTSILDSYMNEQQINNLNDIASNCGFIIKNITRDENLDGWDGNNTLGFRIETQYTLNVVLYISNGNVKSIKYENNYLYNEGNYLSRLTNYLK